MLLGPGAVLPTATAVTCLPWHCVCPSCGGLGPWGSFCDRPRCGLETCLYQTAIPASSQAEGSPGCLHKQVPFLATPCLENLMPPTREKPILFQSPAHPTRKCPTPFIILFIVLFHSHWKRQFYPMSSIFKAKQAAVNALCHCWRLFMLYV